MGLVLSLDEVQLQQVLTLWDYLCICQLREKYGRYRPWSNPLSSKHRGWQKAWWHYAQQSVLSDVRKKLKRTSWKYLGERIDHRRKYVKLYKTKLKCLREEQVIDNDILRELEQMEKEYDIEDILNYRSTAETELQEFRLNSNSSLEVSGASHNDERSSSRARGWSNWLSRGMLGAGGTDNSSQFSPVACLVLEGEEEEKEEEEEETAYLESQQQVRLLRLMLNLSFPRSGFFVCPNRSSLLEAFDLILSSA